MSQYQIIAKFWTTYIKNLLLNKTASLELNDNDIERMLTLAKIAENLHQEENPNNEENSSQTYPPIKEPEHSQEAETVKSDQTKLEEANRSLEKYGYRYGICDICGKEGWVKGHNGKSVCLTCYTIMQD